MGGAHTSATGTSPVSADRSQRVSRAPGAHGSVTQGGGPRSATSARPAFSRRRRTEAAEALGRGRILRSGGHLDRGVARSNQCGEPHRVVVLVGSGIAGNGAGDDVGRRLRSDPVGTTAAGRLRAWKLARRGQQLAASTPVWSGEVEAAREHGVDSNGGRRSTRAAAAARGHGECREGEEQAAVLTVVP
jgi:hypothetical protein